MTTIKDIQSMILYNRGSLDEIRAIGLLIELHNIDEDPN